MELPLGYEFHSPAYHQAGEGCMGDRYERWVCDVRTPKGECLMAVGGSADEATRNAVQRASEHHEFWSQKPEMRLFAQIGKAKKQGRFYERDLVDVVEILAKRLFPNGLDG